MRITVSSHRASPLPIPQFPQLHVHYDTELQAIIGRVAPRGRPCLTPSLLADIEAFQESVRRLCDAGARGSGEVPFRYLAIGSAVPGIYSLGGDLDLFRKLIGQRARAELREYALRCVRITYGFHSALDLPLTTVALVQGNALGGGLEGALSCNLIIAERGVRMGFPEALFNLFPGMGAYSFISRRLGAAQAERMITSGELYEAERLHEMGLVDLLADPGGAEDALRDHDRRVARQGNTLAAVREIRRRYQPLPYEELADIAELWVDMALRVRERDLRVMERLVRAQDRRAVGEQRAGTGPAGASSVA